MTIRLSPEAREQLCRELGQLRHMTLPERRIWSTCVASGTVEAADVREFMTKLESLPAAHPTPGERELIALVART